MTVDAGRLAVARLRREGVTEFDAVALEATTNTWAIVRLVKPHVAEVVVSNPLRARAIADAKVKTDKVDAFVLAQLLRCDYLPACGNRMRRPSSCAASPPAAPSWWPTGRA